jgi:DNA modification methylase
VSEWLDRCHFGDCLETLRGMPGGIVNTCVTSPPYFGLRDYGHAGQIGLEPTPDEFVSKLVAVFAEVRRVLRDDGTLWVNMGDSYAGGGGGNYSKSAVQVDHGQHITNVRNRPDWLASVGVKAKDLIGVPWMLAFALRADGWYLRQDIIWAKPNPMPESVTDRCTKSHEYIFLLSKSATYRYDAEAIKEAATWTRENNPDWQAQRAETNAKKGAGNRNAADGGFTGWSPEDGRNKRSVWTVSTKPYAGAHFATFPTDLIEPCVLAGAPAGGVVLDPFFGSGTTGQVAQALGRRFIGCELNETYKPLQDERLRQPSLLLEAA